MAMPPKDNERRKHFRFRTSGRRGQAELEFGQRRIPVQLFDESAGGFSVVVEKCPDFKRGDVLQLHLDSGVFKAGVVYVCEMEPPEPWRTGPVFRVGLQRLAIVGMTPEEGQSRWSWLAALGLRTGSRPRTVAFGVALALAVVVIVVPVVLTAVLRWSGLHGANLLSESSDRAASLPLHPGAGSQGSHPARPVGLPNRPGAAGGAWPSAPRAADWESFARLSGASVFLAPQTIQELGLSEAQQHEIRQIVNRTTETLEQIDARFRGADRQNQARREEKVLEDARKLAIEVLTPEQRQRFEALLSQSQ
jgi:hypothetical protein